MQSARQYLFIKEPAIIVIEHFLHLDQRACQNEIGYEDSSSNEWWGR